MSYEIILLTPYEILETEKTIPEKLPFLERKILREGVWTVPLTVEKNSFALMDGHHRLQTAKNLNLFYIPCVLLSYEDVFLETRNSEIFVAPEEIIRRGLAGEIYPAKTTRHIFPEVYECFIELDDLRLAKVA